MFDDIGADPQNAAILPTVDGITSTPVAAAATGVLETAGDSDWFAAELTGGLNYAITLTPDPGLAGLQLVIRDASGEALSEPWVVTAASEPGAPLTFSPSVSGTVYLAVSAAEALDPEVSGSYQIQVTPLGDAGSPLEEPIVGELPLLGEPPAPEDGSDPLIDPKPFFTADDELMTIQLMGLADSPRSGGRPPLPWERTLTDPESPVEAPEAMEVNPVRSGRHGRNHRGGHQRYEPKGSSKRIKTVAGSRDAFAGGWGLNGGQRDACPLTAPWSSWDQGQERWLPGINHSF